MECSTPQVRNITKNQRSKNQEQSCQCQKKECKTDVVQLIKPHFALSIGLVINHCVQTNVTFNFFVLECKNDNVLRGRWFGFILLTIHPHLRWAGQRILPTWVSLRRHQAFICRLCPKAPVLRQQLYLTYSILFYSIQNKHACAMLVMDVLYGGRTPGLYRRLHFITFLV